MSSIPESWWIWLAGFIDGEGSIRIARYRTISGLQYQPRIEITNTDALAISHIHAVTKQGSVYVSRQESAKQMQAQRWVITGNPAIDVARKIAPYLRIKDLHARILIAFPMTQGRFLVSPPVRARRAELYTAMQKLNKRGIT